MTGREIRVGDYVIDSRRGGGVGLVHSIHSPDSVLPLPAICLFWKARSNERILEKSYASGERENVEELNDSRGLCLGYTGDLIIVGSERLKGNPDVVESYRDSLSETVQKLHDSVAWRLKIAA